MKIMNAITFGVIVYFNEFVELTFNNFDGVGKGRCHHLELF